MIHNFKSKYNPISDIKWKVKSTEQMVDSKQDDRFHSFASVTALNIVESPWNAGDLGAIPGLRRSSGEGNGNPL